jgi:hypothetical protein
MPKTEIWLAVPEPRDKRELVGQKVVVRPLRKFRRCPGTPVALIQISVAGHILEILHERPVEAAFRSIRSLSLA